MKATMQPDPVFTVHLPPKRKKKKYGSEFPEKPLSRLEKFVIAILIAMVIGWLAFHK